MGSTQQDGSKGRPDILDWFVRIRARRNALGENYNVLIYLGEPPSSPDKWRSSPTLVGQHAVLRGGFGGGRNDITEGFVHLNKHLSNRGMLSKTEDEIDSFIKEKIEWRILAVSASTWFSSTNIVDCLPLLRRLMEKAFLRRKSQTLRLR